MNGYTHPRLLNDDVSAEPREMPPLRKLWSRLYRGGRPQLLLLPSRPTPLGHAASPKLALWRRP